MKTSKNIIAGMALFSSLLALPRLRPRIGAIEEVISAGIARSFRQLGTNCVVIFVGALVAAK